MMRQYYAQRRRGGDDNPLGVGVIAVGSIYYIQESYYFDTHYGGRAVCRNPFIVEAFVNRTCGAARRNHKTGCWEEAYRAGRSDFALVRSLRDRRQVRRVSVHLLSIHEDLGLCQEPSCYPTLPDLSLYRRTARRATRPCGEATPSACPAFPVVPPKSVSVRTGRGDGGSATHPATANRQGTMP